MADTLRERFEDAIRPWKTNPALSVSDIVLDFVREERRRFAEAAIANVKMPALYGGHYSPGREYALPAIAAAEAEDSELKPGIRCVHGKAGMVRHHSPDQKISVYCGVGCAECERYAIGQGATLIERAEAEDA